MKFRRWAWLLAGTSVWLGGCGFVTFKAAGAGDEAGWSKERPDRYDGAECSDVLYTLEESRNQPPPPTEDERIDEQVLLATCARHESGPERLRTTQRAKIMPLGFREVYPTYDDRKPDPVRLAVMACNERFNEQRALGQQMRGRGFDKDEYGAAVDALLSVMLQNVSEGDLTSSLANVNVPEAAKHALVANFNAAKSFYSSETGQLEGAVKELLVDTATHVRQRRKSQFEAQAANWEAFDRHASQIEAAAGEHRGNPELLAQLEALRPKVVAAAGGDYIDDPLFARLTREIALLRALAQDAAGLAAELLVYRRGIYGSNPFPETFAQEVQHAQLAVLSEFDEAKAQYRKAKEAGLDDTTAKTRAGRAFIDWNPTKLVHVDSGIPHYEKLLDKQRDAIPFTEIVDTITPKGDGVVVSFRKTPVETWEYFGCRDTGRIERITSDGRIEYEKHCNTRKTVVMHENVKPLTFPAEEAKQLKRGSMVRGVSVGGEGRIVRLIEKERVVSERGYPVPPRPAHPKAKN